MPNSQRQYTHSEIAEHLHHLAEHANEADKTKLNKLAADCEREHELITGSRRAITESKALLLEIEKMGL